jgi:hypothetical protein
MFVRGLKSLKRQIHGARLKWYMSVSKIVYESDMVFSVLPEEV